MAHFKVDAQTTEIHFSFDYEIWPVNTGFFFLIATGHVMHIDGKEGGGVFSDANLEYSVDQGAALGCQIRY